MVGRSRGQEAAEVCQEAREVCDFEQALFALRAVDQLVSNPVLHPSYPTILGIFDKAWLALFNGRPSVTYPNKFHIINHHLKVAWFNLVQFQE